MHVTFVPSVQRTSPYNGQNLWSQCVRYSEVLLYRDDPRKKKAANRKGIGTTTLKRACNSTTNTRTKYLLIFMHKTLCSIWLTFVRRENETVQYCLIEFFINNNNFTILHHHHHIIIIIIILNSSRACAIIDRSTSARACIWG